MGWHGYFCVSGSFILFGGIVVLIFGVTPNSEHKLDPECYTECAYGVSEYRKNVKRYCKLAAAFGITIGLALCVIEYAAWKCRHGDWDGDCSGRDSGGLHSASIVDRTTTTEDSSYYHITPAGNRILVTRRNNEHTDIYNLTERRSTDSIDAGNNNDDDYYGDSTAPFEEEEDGGVSVVIGDGRRINDWRING